MKLIIRSFQFFVVLVVLIALTITPSRSQVNIKLGGGIGVMSPASDFSGSTIEYYNGSSYGLSSGLNIHGKAKIGLSGFNLAAEIDYSSLSNTGNSEPGQGKVDISQKILSLKVGPEFHFSLPVLPVTPYIGANLALNRFSGETTFQGVSKVPSATYSVKGATRFGVGFLVGTEVSVGPLLSLDFNISYNLMNVSGKEWNDVNPGINQRIDSYLSLNDDPDPQSAAGDDKHFISNERSIHSILFTVSILFGL
ncbi:MAG: outer membrane beta-barrel protein [Bacteroidota bacterium]|nr:outer membrane beta-barrel protein [Bacteroidota bacterium]